MPEVSDLPRELNLPLEFVQRMTHRHLLDTYAAKNHSVEADIRPGPVQPIVRSRPDPRSVRVIRPEQSASVLEYRRGLESPVRPLRAYRAPILEDSSARRDATLRVEGLSPQEREAAAVIRELLAREGVLVTLARVMEVLGPDAFRTKREKSMRQLETLGFPVDLLEYFRLSPTDEKQSRDLIKHISGELLSGQKTEAIREKLRQISFELVKTNPDFAAAEEGGEYDIGLLRVQIGGGYDDGIVRGGSLDVAGQLIAAMPETDFIASAPEKFFENIRWLALNSWPLRRPNRLVLIEEKVRVSPWAQDNGKAGYMIGGGAGFGTPATLVPRYATRDEMDWLFCPGESFLMDGVRAAGHAVFQSPLLFQGGNVLVVRDPKRAERIMLVAETEVYRNVSLGLTRDQVLQAFRIEFGVTRCVVMPVVSYHMDYDVTFRVHDGQLVAFVNDTLAAARLIVARGIAALEQHGLVAGAAVADAKADLARSNGAALHSRIWTGMAPFMNEKRQFRPSLVSAFAAENTDQPVLNFQCFLAALDLLNTGVNESKPLALLNQVGAQGESTVQNDDLSAEYHAALRQLQMGVQAQHEFLRSLGWKVVAVPSMPNLYQSLNYLNGLQDRTRYLMPAMGGFYASVDNAAAAVFQKTLGANVKIVRVLTPDIQRQHGGVHCVVAAYPRVRQTQDTAFQLVVPQSL